MFARILREPAPAPESGGTGTAPAPAPAVTTTATAPAPAPAAAPAPVAITLTTAEYKTFLDVQAELQNIKAETARNLEVERQKSVNALAAKGEVETALKTEREAHATKLQEANAKLETMERSILDGHRSQAVSTGTAATIFVSDAAAAQVRDILDKRLESVRDSSSGQVVIRERGTLRPAAEAVRDWLASKDAEHFILAKSKGGVGASGGGAPAPHDPAKPLTASDVLIARERERRGSPTAAYGLSYRPQSVN